MGVFHYASDTSLILTFLHTHVRWVKQEQSYRTLSDREFGWGGTSVRMEHGCPKSSSVRTETSLRL